MVRAWVLAWLAMAAPWAGREGHAEIPASAASTLRARGADTGRRVGLVVEPRTLLDATFRERTVHEFALVVFDAGPWPKTPKDKITSARIAALSGATGLAHQAGLRVQLRGWPSGLIPQLAYQLKGAVNLWTVGRVSLIESRRAVEVRGPTIDEVAAAARAIKDAAPEAQIVLEAEIDSGGTTAWAQLGRFVEQVRTRGALIDAVDLVPARRQPPGFGPMREAIAGLTVMGLELGVIVQPAGTAVAHACVTLDGCIRVTLQGGLPWDKHGTANDVQGTMLEALTAD